MGKENFSDLGRVEAVRRLLAKGGFEPSSSFPGARDAIVRTASRLWMEGIDFDLTYFPLKNLGYKCIVGAVAELFASLALPKAMSVRIGVSAKLDFPEIEKLWDGMSAAASEYGIRRADLDIVPSYNGLSVSVSVVGESDGATESGRKSARSKDLICLSGNVGGAYLGMRLLESEKERLKKDLSGEMDIDRYRMIVGAYLKPELSPDIVPHLKESGIIPSLGLLVNRGLADAAKRVAQATGLGVKLYSDKIPFEGNSFELGKRLDLDPMSAAMNGGEDYRLMYVVPMSYYETLRHDFQSFSIIGHLAVKEVGTVIVMPEGAELPLHAQGWKETE